MKEPHKAADPIRCVEEDKLDNDDDHDQSDVVLLLPIVHQGIVDHLPLGLLQLPDQRDVEADEEDQRQDEHQGGVEHVQVDHLERPVLTPD